MSDAVVTRIAEVFGTHTSRPRNVDWVSLVERQQCPYLGRTCTKVRKSRPEIAIGSCAVHYGKEREEIVICPLRLLERGQVFTDCLHLLSLHEPGNELHVVPEISIPGGSVDYFLASVNGSRVKDFVGIELQTVDTTGTVWPERQRFLRSVGLDVEDADATSQKTFGINWKMTAKTILIQLHHKVQTFEHLNKHLVLVVQDYLLSYLRRNFQFSHLNDARLGDPSHIHAYSLREAGNASGRLRLRERFSTDSAGIAVSLGLQADVNVDLERMIRQIEAKITQKTLLVLDR